MKLARDVLRLLVHRVEWLPSGVLRFGVEEGVKEPVSDFNGKNRSEIDLNLGGSVPKVGNWSHPSFFNAPYALPDYGTPPDSTALPRTRE